MLVALLSPHGDTGRSPILIIALKQAGVRREGRGCGREPGDPKDCVATGWGMRAPCRLGPLPPTDAPWTVLLASVDPELTSVVVRGLVPARSYQFRLCAVNDVGRSQFSKDTER